MHAAESVYLEQSRTQIADGEGCGDGSLLSLQQRDGVEEDQVPGYDQQQQHTRRLRVHSWDAKDKMERYSLCSPR